MRYQSFRIRNFKGIKDTTIQLGNLTNTNVFAFVGLNESGKTTVLEAIHSFSPDHATAELLGSEVGIPASHTVPRHLISEFTGDVSVEAKVSLSELDKTRISTQLRRNDIYLKPDTFPDEVTFERYATFKNGDFITKGMKLKEKFEVKSKRARVYRTPNEEQKKNIKDSFYMYTPDIAYFPTFIFDFPSHIIYNE